MIRLFVSALVGFVVLVVGTSAANAQATWNPPSREMPQMPQMAQLQDDWRSAVGPWFNGVEGVSGIPAAQVQATGEAGSGGERAQLVRFSGGPLPAAVWTDRNGDGRADMIELYRDGRVAIQLIDADYDGSANVMRIYDASGGLLREERM